MDNKIEMSYLFTFFLKLFFR